MRTGASDWLPPVSWCCSPTVSARVGSGRSAARSDRRVRAFVERVDDAAAARRWLQRQPYVIKDRVSLLGWSNGAIATLWAVQPRKMRRDGLPDFRSAVAFYPGCGTVG